MLDKERLAVCLRSMEAASKGHSAFDKIIRDSLDLPAASLPAAEYESDAYPYTTSVDCAALLLPTGSLWMVGHIDSYGTLYSAVIRLNNVFLKREWKATAPTPALALSLAALKAIKDTCL